MSTLSYQEAKDRAQHGSSEARRELAARTDLPPELLFFLAGDPDVSVRRRIAANSSTPLQADLVLAADADIDVRQDLALKVVRQPLDRQRRMVQQVLEVLARDRLPQVRRILAEALKDVVSAPPEVIRRLAHDAELAVASPVLEFSPVLTDDDLLEIISAPTVAGALSAISRRANVNERVSDAIITSNDIEAVAVLLGNPSAQIREETLDALVDRAPGVRAWHEPLVRRTALPSRAVRQLATFVADNLLAVLKQRSDLDPQTAAEIARVVQKRLEEQASRDPADDAVSMALHQARGLRASGNLTEIVVANALETGRLDFVVAALAVLTEIEVQDVDRILSSHSAKDVLALVWWARLSPELAIKVQLRLAHIPPDEVIRPILPGKYPIRNDEMALHLAAYVMGKAGGPE
ncbi:MAG: DUF2336 domain-containing protein [Alphaproteobacteria bacterium]